MATEDPSPSGLSPTVVHVIDKFASALRADGDIDEAGVGRLEKLLKQASVPKPEDISAVLFDPPKGGTK